MVEKFIPLKEGVPIFLDEIENGIFLKVKGMRGEDNPGYSEFDHGIIEQKLILGTDIIEIPNRNISLLLKTQDLGLDLLSSIVQECMKLAEISNNDFVTIDCFGEKLCNLVSQNNNTKFLEIKPRLFRRVN